VFSRCWSISGVHFTWRCRFTRFALGDAESFWGDNVKLSGFVVSSSVKGSVATLSGLVQDPLFGAEKAELPADETEESENDEQTDAERSNAGRLLSRLSVIRAHSCTGLVLGVNSLSLGAGV
jgi:hypothetical protein